MVELLIGPLYTPERVGGLVRLRDDGGRQVILDPCRVVKVWYSTYGGFYVKYRANPSEAEALRGLVVSILLPDGLVELGRLPAIGGAFKINCGGEFRGLLMPLASVLLPLPRSLGGLVVV